MVALAEEYLSDEEVLSQRIKPSGSGATMLGLIGLEIYLKAILLLETGHRPVNHDFSTIWKRLPAATKSEVLAVASNRYSIHVDFNNLEFVLSSWKKSFEIGRYSYELNDFRSYEEVASAGEDWVSKGLCDEDADLAYFPMERAAVIHGLRSYWDNRQNSI